MRMTEFKTDYHRNGMCGAPFDVCLFTIEEGGVRRRMLAVLFPEKGECAVIDIGKVAVDDDISFQTNSWRGDRFEEALRDAVDKQHNIYSLSADQAKALHSYAGGEILSHQPELFAGLIKDGLVEPSLDDKTKEWRIVLTEKGLNSLAVYEGNHK